MLNNVQIELLEAMASLKKEEDLLALKRVLVEFFAKRVDEEMDKLWNSGKWNEQTLQDLKTAHYRTPYVK